MTPDEEAMWKAAAKFGAPQAMQPVAQPAQSISLDKILKAQRIRGVKKPKP